MRAPGCSVPSAARALLGARGFLQTVDPVGLWCLTNLVHIATNLQKLQEIMLRIFDNNNVDITDQRQYCYSPTCLGEPWCSAWGICASANEPVNTATTTGMEQEMSYGSGFDDFDLGELLDSSPTPLLEVPPSSSIIPEHLSANSEAPTCSSSSLPPQDSSRFAEPKTNDEVAEARKDAVPKKTRQDTEYCRVFEAWRAYRNSCGSTLPTLLEMDKHTLSHWLIRFVLEARKANGSEYPPNTLHHIVCGIMRHMRSTTMPGVDFFTQREFASFRDSLDAEMKRLQSSGLGSTHKQAEPLSRAVMGKENSWRA